MEQACEAARDGRREYFDAIGEGALAGLLFKADADGRTLLHNAVAGGNASLCKWLLGLGAECNTADDEVRKYAECYP